MDGSFAPVPPDGSVSVLIATPDQKLLAGGDFTKFDTKSRARIARLNSNGAVDDSFNPGDGFNSTVYAIALQPDGKILVGGSFSQFNNAQAQYAARLNADGSLDTAFQNGAGPNSTVFAILPLPNGDFLLGGGFSAFGGNSSRPYLVRLHADGSLDNSFNPSVNSTVYAIAQQPDGQFLIGGDFTSVGGQPRNRIARLAADGSLDASFDPGGGPDSTVRTILLLPDNRILISGSFGTVNGGPFAYVARLLPGGLPDFDFHPSANGTVYTLALQSDGRIAGGGDFTGRVGRIRANGATDPSFSPGTGANSSVTALVLQANGDFVIGGSFTQVNGSNAKYLARLKGQKLAPGGQIDFGSNLYVVSEAQPSVSIEVRRTGNTGSAVTIDVATSNGTANAGDYVPKTETISFAAGETKKNFIVTIRQDTLVEDDETFNIALTNPTGGAVLGVENTAQVKIVSDDNSTAIGSVDTAFGSGITGSSISTIRINSEGKILVGGDFRAIAGQSRFNLARLDSAGIPDLTFRAGAWADGPVLVLSSQDDGKVMMGGAFSTVNGVSRRYLARLNSDGSYDPGFSPASPNSYVYALLSLPFGDCLVGGSFSSLGSSPAPYLVKVFTDGSIDTTFTPQVDNTVMTIVQQPDGKFLIGGDFTHAGGLLRNRIARLNSDGSVDRSFDPGAGADGTVRTISLQGNNVIMGGAFGTVNGGPWGYIARLLPTGLPDATFASTPISGTVYAAAVQPDGRIVVGGDFPGRLTRLTVNGAVDPTVAGAGTGADSTVSTVALQADGQILAGGSFRQFNGFARNGLARVQGASAAVGGVFEFGSASYSVSESLPNVSLEILRGGSTTQAASVDFATAPGTATAGDFVPTSGKVSFAAGETRKSISISIRADTIVEDDESFSVTLSNPSTGADLGSVRVAQVTIKDDDSVSGAGALDTSFRADVTGGGISTVSVTPDGKILVGGDFRIVNGASRVDFTRLQPDGKVDPDFYPALWLDGPVYTSLVQDDGKVVIGGVFSSISGIPRRYVGRLNPDGTFDDSFNVGSSINSYVYSIASLGQGDLLIGGSFSTFNGDPKRIGLVKVFSDGSLDASFNPQLNGSVLAIAIQADGKIVIGGDFTSVNGQVKNRLARLNRDGTLDPAFEGGVGVDSSVRTIAVQPDKKIVIGGAFGSINGVSQPYLGRLTSAGLPDLDFAPSLNSTVYSVALQDDGKILAGGDFTGKLLRLLPNGTPDSSIISSATGANAAVLSVALQPDGNIVLGGNFTQFNGLRRVYLARVQGLNDSSGGELEFSTALLSLPESQPTASVDVRRNGNTDAAVTVDYTTVTGTATAGDYTPQTGTLIFGTGESRKTIVIPIRQDTVPEDTESFRVVLSNPAGGAVLGSQTSVEIRILNDDFFTNPGALDLTLGASGAALGNSVNAVVVAPDGKMIVGGDFRAILGQTSFNLVRLLSDGTLDPAFDPSLFFDGVVYAAAVQPDGKVLVGGSFGSVDGISRRYIARLNNNGTVDAGFNPGAGPNSSIYAIHLLSSGDILVAGTFNSYNGESPRYGLVKLFSDGTRDTLYNPQLNASVYAIVEQSDGKILIGGDFTSAGGQPRNRIARLNPDGSLDATFAPGTGADSSVLAIALQADRNILVGGNFGNFNSTSHPYLARLLPDGSTDQNFNPTFNGGIQSIYVDRDSRIHVGGGFGTVNNASQTYYAALNLDGSLNDLSTASAPINGSVLEITADSTGRLLLGGTFTRVASLNRQFFVRLNAARQATPFRFTNLSYNPGDVQIFGTGGNAGPAVLEFSTDLKNWSQLQNNPVTGLDIKFDDAVAAPRKFYRLRQ